MLTVFKKDCIKLAFALIALMTSVAVFGADQKPLVVNPTSGKTEQLQAGNRLQIPDASGDLVVLAPGVQTASRVVTYPIFTGDRTLAVIDQAQTFTADQTVLSSAVFLIAKSSAGNANIISDGSAGNAAIYRYRVGGTDKFNHYVDTNSNLVFTDSTNSTTPLQYLAGTISNGYWSFANTKASSSSSNGALVVAGGVGIGGSLNTASDITVASPSTTGQIVVTAVSGQIAQVHIRGNGVASGLNIQHSGSSDAIITNLANRPMFIGTNGLTRMTIAAAGDVSFTGAITVGSTTLLATSVALTNGAAAQVGTLTNAPTAGNPTKWIPINDNGTTRYLPAW